MRLFTAIELPTPMKQALSAICYGVPRVRWCPPEQMHLTLVFIGEANPARLEALVEALETVKLEPFRLDCQGIGSFHSGALWLGVVRHPALMRLEAEIRHRLRTVDGLNIDGRKYSPHITLGRLARDRHPNLAPFLQLHERSRYSFEVDGFVLKSSLLTEKGARHRVIGEFRARQETRRCVQDRGISGES